jgi:hypothetical protein
MAIWNNNLQACFNRESGSAPWFLPKAYAMRWERIRQARMLREGQHRRYYLEEGRTQFNFPMMRVGGSIIRPYVSYNLFGLISNKSADLLFGKAPVMTADNPVQQAALDALADRCNLLPLLHGAATSASAESECFLEAVEYDGDVYLQIVDAQEIYPVGTVRPDGQHAAYDRYQVDDAGKLLLVTRYSAGSISRKLYKLGERQLDEADVNLWPYKTSIWGPVVATGMSVNLITWIPNLLLGNKAISDYDGAIDQQDKVNAANTQIARVLAKHADPKMAFPRDSFGADGNLLASDDAFAKGNDGETPEYITWSGELESAMKDRAFAVNAMLISTEMSPVLLGLKEGAAPDAYKKVRLEAFNSLSKAQRKSLYFTLGLKWALWSAQELEQTFKSNSFIAGYPVGPIGVELRDGIPVDESEQATTLTTLTGGKAVMSVERAVEILNRDPAMAAAELNRLKEDAAAATPSILLGNEPGMSETNNMPVSEGSGQVNAA